MTDQEDAGQLGEGEGAPAPGAEQSAPAAAGALLIPPPWAVPPADDPVEATPEGLEAEGVVEAGDIAAGAVGGSVVVAPPDMAVHPTSANETTEQAIPRPPGGTVLIPPGLARRPEQVPSLQVDVEVDRSDNTVAEHADADAGDEPGGLIVSTSIPPVPASIPPSGVSLPPYVPSVPPGVVPSDVIDAARRREEVARRGRRRKSMLLFGGLGSAIVLVVVMLVVVIAGQGGARDKAADKFFGAHRIAFTTMIEANQEVTDAMAFVAAEERPGPAAVGDVVDGAIEDVRSLQLPVASGKFAAEADRLRDAVDVELDFLSALNAFAVSDPHGVDSASDRLMAAWEDAKDGLDAAHGDATGLPRVNARDVDTGLAAFTDAVTAEMARFEQIAAERVKLEQYQRDFVTLLNRYQELRTQLENANYSQKTIDDTNYARIQGEIRAAATARYQIAEQLDNLAPLPQFATLHSTITSTITLLANEVSNAYGAVSDAYCYDYGEVFEAEYGACPTMGDTFIYQRYLGASAPLGAEFQRTYQEWQALYANELAKLG